MTCPRGCDTFVVLPPKTANGCVVFGKNSDRPHQEVQEVICVDRQKFATPTKLACTYIEIDQTGETHAVVLSKPSWMWGAEMGANERGVVIGNEAVWTNVEEDDEERLLGMDLLRLGLERGGSARESMDVMTALLERHGQGGNCAEDSRMTYHNSFLIADPSEAWVLETAGKYWAAERVQRRNITMALAVMVLFAELEGAFFGCGVTLGDGFRNISNNLTIGSRIDAESAGLREAARQNGQWDGKGAFSFKNAFSDWPGDTPRRRDGEKLLRTHTADEKFDAKRMMSVLRDVPSGICMQRGGGFVSTGSQVSVLSGSGQCMHFFTGTPDPGISIFKPFVFGDDGKTAGSKHIESPPTDPLTDPAKTKIDRRHALYGAHERAFSSRGNEQLVAKMRQMEGGFIESVLSDAKSSTGIKNASTLLNDCVEAELALYE